MPDDQEQIAVDPSLHVVFGCDARDALQRALDPSKRRALVITAMQRGHALVGRCFSAIYVRPPTEAWLAAKRTTVQDYEQWERRTLAPLKLHGAIIHRLGPNS